MKKAVLSLILQVLYRTMRVLEKRDTNVAGDMAQLAEGACVRIRAGLSSDAPQLTVVHKDGRLVKGDSKQRADIEIMFKSVSGAFRVFTGFESIGQAYCQHRFVLSGNINETMCSSAPSKRRRAICSPACGIDAFSSIAWTSSCPPLRFTGWYFAEGRDII